MAQLLERQGYYGTGLNEIVQQSGAPKGSLYHYFPGGKEELAAAAITDQGKRIAEYIRGELAKRDDPVEAIPAPAADAFVSADGSTIGISLPSYFIMFFTV